MTRDLASLGAPLWLDAGVQSVREARHAVECGAARVVVGLETLPSVDVLADVCQAVGGDRVAFSLDLRDGQPMAMKSADISAGQKGVTLILIMGLGFAGQPRLGWRRSRGATVGVVTLVRGNPSPKRDCRAAHGAARVANRQVEGPVFHDVRPALPSP